MRYGPARARERAPAGATLPLMDAERVDDDPVEGLQVAFDVLPLGLFLGGIAAVARGLLAAGQPIDGLDEEGQGFRVLAQAERWPEVLAEALIAAVVASLALGAAERARRVGPTAIAGVITFAAFTAYLSGFPAATPGLTPPAIAAAFGLTLLGFGIGRLGFRGFAPLVLGALVGIGAPAGLAAYVRSASEGMPVRLVLVDLVAAPDLFTTVTGRQDAQPEPGVLTPAVDQQTDTGDKPALVLPPPASQEFVVPAVADRARLQAAVGADLSVVERLPKGTDELRVDYRILVDGKVAWSETVAHRRMPPGVWDTSGFRWRHVESDGERGIPVLAGQTVRFETEFAPAEDGGPQDVEGLKGENLRLGFGGVTLERTLREPRRVATAEAPNIVFVVMDTLRLDRIGAYGYDGETTPRLDAFAERSLVFEDAYTTSSWTWPSTASLLTGRLPDAHGVKSSEACTLGQRLPTLAEALQARGYTTAAFVGNPIVEPNRYFDQGFETFDVEVPYFRMSDLVVPQAIEWLEKHAPLRFFLYLHLVDPHTPHRPHPEEAARLGLGPAPADWPERGLDGVLRRDEPSDEVKRYANDLYDASVATGDRWFGEVLDALDRLELSDSTIVVFTSDHGEELFDRVHHGHGHDVTAELVRAPLVVRGPGIPVGRRRGVVSNRHVPTTLARLVGARLRTPGVSVHLVDEAPPDEALYETTKGVWGGDRYQQLYGLRRGTEVTHWRQSDLALDDVPTGDLRRYDALSDPTERSDLIKIQPDTARSHVRRIREIVEEAAEARPPLVLGVGAQGYDQLKTIGYAGEDEQKGDEDRREEDEEDQE